MPLYQYECPKCQWHKPDMRTVAERNDGPECWHCSTKMELIIASAPAAIVKNPAVPRSYK